MDGDCQIEGRFVPAQVHASELQHAIVLLSAMHPVLLRATKTQGSILNQPADARRVVNEGAMDVRTSVHECKDGFRGTCMLLQEEPAISDVRD